MLTLRTYLVKSITNTLSTMSILNKKWMIYSTSVCLCCDKRDETNKHLWKCEKSTHTVNNIVFSFHQKYHIYDRMWSHTLLALRSISMMNLTKKIATFIRMKQDDPTLAVEIRDKVKQAYLSLVTRGRKEVWLSRNEATITYQKHILNIFTKNKCELLLSFQLSQHHWRCLSLKETNRLY